jgi:hypothetical protein
MVVIGASATLAGARPRVQTGDPLPTVAPAAACRRAAATRWLDSSHTPFASVDREVVQSAAENCCGDWARKGERWRAVDAYGQILGMTEVLGGEGYDVTQCYQIHLRKTAPAGVLFASDGGSWSPPPSARWEPDAAARTALDQLVGARGSKKRSASRQLFFRLPSGERWAVIGGHALVLAQLDADGTWKSTQKVDEFHDSPSWGYQPVAVFDLDGDGVPEVVGRVDMEEAWHDAVFKRDPRGVWREVAASVGRGTA